MEYKYRVVRTYSNRYNKTTDYLNDYLDAGYEYVHSTPFISKDGDTDLVEYVIRKRVQN